MQHVERHMNRLISVILAILVVVLGILLLASVRASAIKCPAGKICLDPDRTSCFVFDMGRDRWRLVAKDERHYLSARVMAREADYKFQRRGVDCYARDEFFVLGEQVATLPVEWWRPRARR